MASLVLLITTSVTSVFSINFSSDLDPAEAGFLEPVATVCKGMKKLRLQPQETVVVIGAGTMGMVNAQVARCLGARVTISEIMPKKLETAKAMGFDVIDCNEKDPVEAVKEMTNGMGVDCVIVAVGSTKANAQALEMLRERRSTAVCCSSQQAIQYQIFRSTLT